MNIDNKDKQNEFTEKILKGLEKIYEKLVNPVVAEARE